VCKVHQMLMQAQNHPDLPSTELMGAEEYMLADVGFFKVEDSLEHLKMCHCQRVELLRHRTKSRCWSSMAR
jgi:hypothetical protein